MYPYLEKNGKILLLKYISLDVKKEKIKRRMRNMKKNLNIELVLVLKLKKVFLSLLS